MKHRLCLTILLGLATLIARAQQDLNVSPVFQGKIVPRGEMVDVRAKRSCYQQIQIRLLS